MAKLTKKEIAGHKAAMQLIESDHELSFEEKMFVLDNYHEGATNNNAAASAHFTPWDLGFHLAIEVTGHRILDIGAGIGCLSMAVETHIPDAEFVLVEINPEYAKIAQRIMPRAIVICGSLYDKNVQNRLRAMKFDTVISNPPFGSNAKGIGGAPRNRSSEVHYDFIDIASDLASNGVFILPQNATPFRYSGRNSFEEVSEENCRSYTKFAKTTGIKFDFNCGIDTKDISNFRGVKIATEIVLADFDEARTRRGENHQLFDFAA